MKRIVNFVIVSFIMVFFIGNNTLFAQSSTTVNNDSIQNIPDSLSLSGTLPEFYVIGERPIVKVMGSSFIYDVPRLIENKPVGNTLEALLQIPGITGSDNSISLVGAKTLNIVINGKQNVMTLEQVLTLIKSIPASQVKNIEIMYSVPSKYGVRGSLINIELKKSINKSLVGETGFKYLQSYYPTEGINTNLLYSSSKMNFDFLADYENGKNYSEANTYTRYNMGGNKVELNQDNIKRNTFDDLNLRLGWDINLNEKSSISSAYYYSGKWTHSDLKSFNTVSNMDSMMKSINNEYFINRLHNAHLEYDFKVKKGGFIIGGDYLAYNSPSWTKYAGTENDYEELNNFSYNSLQDINQLKLFVNGNYSFSQKLNITVGTSSGFNNSDIKMTYYYPNHLNDLEKYKQEERTTNFFAEFSGELNNKLTYTVGLETEYFKSDFIVKNIKDNLWKGWTFFPKLSINYSLNERDILQLNLTSDKNYPSYWAVSPLITYNDNFTETVGNPLLKPGRDYTGQIIYMLHKKYLFILGTSYMPDYFALIPYQDNEKMRTIYSTENYDYTLFTNISVILPFHVGSWWRSRAGTHLLRMQDKMDDFYNTSFNNSAYVYAFSMNNTFLIPNAPVSFQLDYRYQSPSIQGIYKLGQTFNSSFSCKYDWNKNLYIIVSANNLFRDAVPNPYTIDYDKQYSIRRSKELFDCSIRIAWRFGNYKKGDHASINSSRFQR